MMQIASLIICPAFLSAMWYVLLGKLISVIGSQYVSGSQHLAVQSSFCILRLAESLSNTSPSLCVYALQSSINPKTYMIVFVTGDVLSLVVQSIGGGSAASADTPSAANRGGYIMVAGVDIQMAIMLAYTFVFIDFLWRYTRNKPVRKQFGIKRFVTKDASRVVTITPQEVRKTRWLIGALGVSTVAVFLR